MESTGRRGRRVTIRRMVPLLATSALLLGGTCTDDEPTTREDPGEAALAAVEDLQDEIDDLRAEIADDTDSAGRDLRGLERDLRRAIKDLRESFRSLRAGNSQAESDAAAALARVSEVASDLEVLEERYNFHLRRYHGGG